MKVISDEIGYWNGLRSGSESGLRSLYLLFYDDLFQYGIYLTNDAILSKEYINKVFANLWFKRNVLPEVNSPKAYIVASFRNLVIFKKQSRSAGMLVYPGDTQMPIDEYLSFSSEDAMIELEQIEQQKGKIKTALSSLTERQKEIINARFMLEKSYEEIADEFQITVRTVYNSIHESLKILRGKLSKGDFV